MQTIKEVEIDLLRGVDPTNHQIACYMPYTYLVSLDLDKWTQAHDGGKRYGAMTTNISECFNGVLKGAQIFGDWEESYQRLRKLLLVYLD